MLILLFLLAGSLASGTPDQATQTPDARVEAQRLAESGSHEAALDRFRAIAAANPADVEARIWIGRLDVWMRRPTAAENVFRSVLLDAPENVDALTELGALLTTRGRLQEAITFLGRAEKLTPENPVLLAALGRAHRLAHRDELALAYYRRAALLAPNDAVVSNGLEQVRRRHGHRLALTFFDESLDVPAPESRSGEISLSYRATDRLRVSVGGQQQRKLSRTESRAGGAVEWRPQWAGPVTLRAHGLVGPDNVVLPRADAGGAIEVTRRATILGAGIRYFSFGSARVWAVTPSVAHEIDDRVVFSASYTRSLTQFSSLGTDVGNNSGTLGVQVHVHPRIRLDAGYARGIENFDRFSADRLGRFRADTVSGGMTLDLRGLTSLVANYEYQWREDERSMRRITASIVHAF